MDLAGSVLYAVGCHGGLPVAGSDPTDADHSLDLPQSFLSRGAVAYVANSGYGWGLGYGGGLLALVVALVPVTAGAERLTLSLDGTWRIADSVEAEAGLIPVGIGVIAGVASLGRQTLGAGLELAIFQNRKADPTVCHGRVVHADSLLHWGGVVGIG